MWSNSFLQQQLKQSHDILDVFKKFLLLKKHSRKRRLENRRVCHEMRFLVKSRFLCKSIRLEINCLAIDSKKIMRLT